MTRTMRILTLGLALAIPAGLVVAQPRRVNAPNLTAAQNLTAQAYAKLEAAQVANEYELGGHAAKAKELLRQANEEIKLAIEKKASK
jgi:hypothetical protein